MLFAQQLNKLEVDFRFFTNKQIWQIGQIW